MTTRFRLRDAMFPQSNRILCVRGRNFLEFSHVRDLAFQVPEEEGTPAAAGLNPHDERPEVCLPPAS